jgi:hypothetical protein
MVSKMKPENKKTLITNKSVEDFDTFDEEVRENALSLLGEFGSTDDEVQQEKTTKSDKKILKG